MGEGSLPNFNFFNVNAQIFQLNRKIHLANCLDTNFHNISNIISRVIRRRNYSECEVLTRKFFLLNISGVNEINTFLHTSCMDTLIITLRIYNFCWCTANSLCCEKEQYIYKPVSLFFSFFFNFKLLREMLRKLLHVIDRSKGKN